MGLPAVRRRGLRGRGGHLAVVQWLARNGGSVTQLNDDGGPPLWTAANTGHLEVVQWPAGNGGSVSGAWGV